MAGKPTDSGKKSDPSELNKAPAGSPQPEVQSTTGTQPLDANTGADQPTTPKPLVETQDPLAQKQASQADKQRTEAEGNKQVAIGNLPDVTVPKDKAEEKTESLENFPKLEGAELDRAQLWQKNLGVLLPKIWKVDREPGQSAEDARKAGQKQVQELIAEVEKESAEGKFGPATQKAYQRFLDWYQKEAVPGTITLMDSMGLQPPAGCPCELPLNENGRPILPQLHKNLVAIGEAQFKTPLDKSKVPSDDNIDMIEKGLDWLDDCNTIFETSSTKRQFDLLTTYINDEGLPQNWHLKPGEDMKAWVQSASEMVDLASRNRNYIEGMHSLFKASTERDFPFQLPPGTSIELTIKDKTHTIRAGEEAKNMGLLANKHGTITRVSLDLPQDVRQEHLKNSPKIKRNIEWLNSEHCTKVEQALAEYIGYQKHPERVLMVGDQEIPDTPGRDHQGLFNKNNELIGIVNASEYKPRPGERMQNVNLMEYDYSTQKTDDGRILVEQNIQGWEMPDYAYQNIRAFGDKVGKPMAFTKAMPPDFEKQYEAFEIKIKGEARTLYKNKDNPQDLVEIVGSGEDKMLKEVKLYQPNDFVVMRNGSDVEIRRACQLELTRESRKTSQNIQMGLGILVDGALLASTFVGVGALALGSRAAIAGVQIAGKQFVMQAAKVGVRALVAGAGVFNNAGAREHAWGRNVNTARHIYFMADITHGLIRGGTKLAGIGQSGEVLGTATRALTGAEKMEKAINSSSWVSRANKATELTFRASELAFAPVIGKDLVRLVKKMGEKGARDPLNDAAQQIGDGRGLHKLEANGFNPGNKPALEGAREVLKTYSDTLASGRTKETSDEVKKIFAETDRLIGPDASQAEKESFKQSLIKNVAFSNEDIALLEKTQRASLPLERDDEGNDKHPDSDYYNQLHLSKQEIDSLLDPAKRKTVEPEALRKLAEEILAKKNADVRAASIIALTYLCRDADGTVPETLASTTAKVAEYKTTVDRTFYGEYEESSPKEITVTAHDATVSLSSKDAIEMLLHDFEVNNTGSRGIATGDLLVRTGVITHRQYGGILQDILNDPKASPEDKMRAMVNHTGTRIAGIIDGARLEDSQGLDDLSEGMANREIGKRFGLTADDMVKTLERLASNPNEKNADVRAMASVLLYGLDQTDDGRKKEMLQAVTDSWTAKCGSLDGRFSKEVVDLLRRDMTTPVTGDTQARDQAKQQKLNAALAMARITPHSDADTQKQINQAIAESFSSTDSALSVKVLDALVPERIKQLEKDNSSLTNDARNQMVNMVRIPATHQEARNTVKLLERAGQLFTLDKDRAISGDTKVNQAGRLAANLMNLIDPASGQEYAQFFPTLRAAAIDTLGSFGNRKAKDLIRTHLSTEGTIKIPDSNRTVTFNEPDARVRMSALKALQLMNDADLPALAPKLIGRERDPEVANKLRDVRFLAPQVEPGSPEWDTIKDKYAEKITFGEVLKQRLNGVKEEKMSADLKSITGGVFDYEAFLQNNEDLKLLREKDFIHEANQRAKGSWGFLDRFNPFGEARIDMEKGAVSNVESERNQAWQNLANRAKQAGDDSLPALVATYQILERSGGVLGAPGDNKLAVDGDLYVGTRSNPDWERNAAAILAQNVEPGPNNSVVKYMLRTALEQSMTNDNPEATKLLLQGWKRMYQNGSISTVEEYAGALARALDGSLSNHLTTSSEHKAGVDQVRKLLLADLAEAKHRNIMPIFEAVAERADSKEVKEMAARLLSDFRDSVDMMWNSTKPADPTISPAVRAENVHAALMGQITKKGEDGEDHRAGSAEKTVQVIFDNYKGIQITDENDPGMPFLYQALDSENERVRLAAAKIIGQSALAGDSIAKERAFDVLQKMTENGSRPRYKLDAEAYLLEGKRREFPGMVAANKDVLLEGVGWLRTAASGLSDQSDSVRARHIEKAIADSDTLMNYEDTVKGIFEAAKGRNIVSENDARRAPLTVALKHENERVRFAAAWTLAESGVAKDRGAATAVLADLAVNSKSQRRALEAKELLRDIAASGNPEDRKSAEEAWTAAYRAAHPNMDGKLVAPPSSDDPMSKIKIMLGQEMPDPSSLWDDWTPGRQLASAKAESDRVLDNTLTMLANLKIKTADGSQWNDLDQLNGLPQLNNRNQFRPATMSGFNDPRMRGLTDRGDWANWNSTPTFRTRTATRDERVKMAYYARGPVSQLEEVVANGSLQEKKELVRQLSGLTDEAMDSWLAPAPPPPAQFGGAVSCLTGKPIGNPIIDLRSLNDSRDNFYNRQSGNRFTVGAQPNDFKWQANKKLDDYLNNMISGNGVRHPRDASVPTWTPVSRGEKPILTGGQLNSNSSSDRDVFNQPTQRLDPATTDAIKRWLENEKGR